MTLFPEFFSGLSILLHARVVQSLVRGWKRGNALVRPWFLPFLHILMLLITFTIVGAAIFANQHARCWYDEVYMLDPPWHWMTTGVWQSVAQWDAVDIVPFAPNYPLFACVLYFLFTCFGCHFVIFRGAMLFFGFVPVVALLWLLRRKGLLRSRGEVIQVMFFIACFTFFHWAVYLRPEAVLLFVVTLLVFSWVFDRPLLLFLSASLVPLCGIQWNVLLLPVALHWLFFGGRIRNPLLVVVAFTFSSIVFIVAYHVLGMWPSYLQESARVGGFGAFHNAFFRLHAVYSAWDFSWIFAHSHLYPHDVFVFVFSFFIFLSIVCRNDNNRYNYLAIKLFAFVFLASFGVLLSIALFGNLNHNYPILIALPIILLFPAMSGDFFTRHLLLLPVLAFLALVPAKVRWQQIRCGDMPAWRGVPPVWADAHTLLAALQDVLGPGETCWSATLQPISRLVGFAAI